MAQRTRTDIHLADVVLISEDLNPIAIKVGNTVRYISFDDEVLLRDLLNDRYDRMRRNNMRSIAARLKDRY